MSLDRVDGLDKLSGKSAFVDDLTVPGCLFGGTIRSPVARGRIRKIHFSTAVDWSDFVIVDHRDIPGSNEVALIESDQPALASTNVRHLHEPVLLLAHSKLHRLREGLRSIRVEIEAAPPLFDVEAQPTKEMLQHGSDNVFKRIDIRKGDPASVFAKASRVIEGTYRTGSQEHVYLETQGMIAHQEGETLVVRGSMQCPYYILDALTIAFDRPKERFRVIQCPLGGGFGGKEEYPSVVAIHAALLAEKAGRPVKIIYDRQEDMAVTTKRHPSRVRHRTAVDDDGIILAMEIDILFDGGAYVTLSPVVLSRGTLHATGPYRCDHVHVHGEAKLTNSPPYGAFRGFGAPQTLFAIERHMDVIARDLGLDPGELRRRNLLCQGDTLATGQKVQDGVDLTALLARGEELAGVSLATQEYAAFNRSHPYLRRGVGRATFYHGAGFTGSGETHLASEVWVEGLADGRVRLLTAQTDMGQGTMTILAQIAGETLSVDPRSIEVVTPDTSLVPNSGPTVASRTAMVVGKLIEDGCRELQRILDSGSGPPSGKDFQNALELHHRENPGDLLRVSRSYQTPPGQNWDEVSYQGDAYACYSWAAHLAHVEVDLRTFQVRVTDYVALQEVGRVLNEVLARGQIQGGVAQGLGWTLLEEVILENGAMKNHQMMNYIIPGSGDLSPIRVFFEEIPSPSGPGGAKGIGELPLDGPAPAIINAVCHALSASIREIPLTPEVLMEFLGGKE